MHMSPLQLYNSRLKSLALRICENGITHDPVGGMGVIEIDVVSCVLDDEDTAIGVACFLEPSYRQLAACRVHPVTVAV
jgi:hypothetical protein